MKIIGISGNARSGKDSFAEALRDELVDFAPQLNPRVYAFADPLKRELDPFFIEQFGISATAIPDDKKHIYRPLLIAHGQVRRMETDNKYWIDKLKEKFSLFPPGVAIVSDLRYIVGDNSEFDWIKSFGGLTVNIKRFEEKSVLVKPKNKKPYFRTTKIFTPPASDDEAENEAPLEEAADFNVEWETVGDVEIKKLAREKAMEFYIKFINYFNG